jgi:hypothetical protein
MAMIQIGHIALMAVLLAPMTAQAEPEKNG